MAFPTQESTILENEKEIGYTFPSSFRNKMMKENGGHIECDDDDWELFPFFDKTDRKTISRTCNSIAKETKSAREWRGFPENAIAIASNGGGDYLVFIQEGASLNNEVYVWLHETAELHKIADDFSEIS